jgi:hypothetical protein
MMESDPYRVILTRFKFGVDGYTQDFVLFTFLEAIEFAFQEHHNAFYNLSNGERRHVTKAEI